MLGKQQHFAYSSIYLHYYIEWATYIELACGSEKKACA